MSKISKVTTFLMMAAMFSLGLFIASCNNGEIKSVSIPVPRDTSALASINHFIPEATIKVYRGAFKTEQDSLALRFPSLLIPDAEAFNKPALLEILKDPRCVGIRIYHGVKTGGKRNEIRVIIVGVDSEGKDILISGGSSLATDITQSKGGLEDGQCPSCQTPPPPPAR